MGECSHFFSFYLIIENHTERKRRNKNQPQIINQSVQKFFAFGLRQSRFCFFAFFFYMQNDAVQRK
jgi:hypothetical protein